MHFIVDFARAAWMWEEIFCLIFFLFSIAFAHQWLGGGAAILSSLIVFYNSLCKRATPEADVLGSCRKYILWLISYVSILGDPGVVSRVLPLAKETRTRKWHFLTASRLDLVDPMQNPYSPFSFLRCVEKKKSRSDCPIYYEVKEDNYCSDFIFLNLLFVFLKPCTNTFNTYAFYVLWKNCKTT